MKNLIWFYYRIKSYMINRYIAICKKEGLKRYIGKKIMDANDTNLLIKDKILSGEPFMVARFGATELLNMHTQDFGAKGRFNADYRFNQLCNWSGFFPNNISLCSKFVEHMKMSCKEIDIMAVWFNSFEDYYIKKYFKKEVKLTLLENYEPWKTDIHWSSALKGKKVLVIHPFEETIKSQYKKREKLFVNTDILPEFELITLKAVQTIAGENDDRFNDWFEALDYMYKEAMTIDFDIAIIGCGAYGLPLAAKLKKSGKQVIHLAGATQILFGIKGNRWEQMDKYEYVRKWFNSEWINPKTCDTPKKSQNVEGGCYW